MLFVEAILFVEFFHLAVDDLLDHGLRFSRLLRLILVNLAFAIENFLCHFFAPQKSRVERSDMHRHVVAKPLKVFRACHEIALAVHFHQHADLSAGMNI